MSQLTREAKKARRWGRTSNALSQSTPAMNWTTTTRWCFAIRNRPTPTRSLRSCSLKTWIWYRWSTSKTRSQWKAEGWWRIKASSSYKRTTLSQMLTSSHWSPTKPKQMSWPRPGPSMTNTCWDQVLLSFLKYPDRQSTSRPSTQSALRSSRRHKAKSNRFATKSETT